MDKPTHTPGPWVACDTGSEHSTLISGNGGSDTTRNGGIYIARVQGPDNRANARLIAAAPDLLEELEQQADGCSTIISLLSGQQSAVASSLVGMLRFQEVNARAAIAKARATPETTP